MCSVNNNIKFCEFLILCLPIDMEMIREFTIKYVNIVNETTNCPRVAPHKNAPSLRVRRLGACHIAYSMVLQGWGHVEYLKSHSCRPDLAPDKTSGGICVCFLQGILT